MTIEELYFFFEGVQKKQYELTRIMGMTQGADIPTWESMVRGDDVKTLNTAADFAMLPIALGYQRVD